MPSVTALNQTGQEIDVLGKKFVGEAMAQAAADSAALTATVLDPTGLSTRIVAPLIMRGQVELAKRQEAENKPLRDKANTQGEHLVKEAEPLKSDARFQRLMQMDKEKNCH